MRMSKEQIAERLRAAREAAGITQKEAADALGITLQAISSYERAVTRIDVESLGILCSLYGVSVDSIVNGPHATIIAAAAHFNPEKLTEEGRQMYLQYIQYLADRFSKDKSEN